EVQESCTHRKNPAPTAENQHPAPAEILHQPQDFNTPGVQDFNTPPRDINTPPEGGGRASAREAPTAPTTGSGRIDEHPAVQEYRRIYPSVEVHWRFLEHIAAKIGTDGPSMDAWTETLLLWHGKDYDPTNVTGLISRWRKVKAEGRTTHHTSPTWKPETPETPYANAVWLKEDYPHVFENAEA
ncbi:MAG: hypothetical protein GVY12_12600, partial [Bacteroidetes bacterium]|nr:hypothetical protein [Bacteroidota bacterium]